MLLNWKFVICFLSITLIGFTTGGVNRYIPCNANPTKKNITSNAECGNRGHTEVPIIHVNEKSKNTNLTILLDENPLGSLENRSFSDKPDKKVTIVGVYLNWCEIGIIKDEAFADLDELTTLNLNFNNLPEVPTKALSILSNLKYLALAVNPITVLRFGAFEGLSNLETLILNRCNISTIGDDTFLSLTSLKILWMWKNEINNITIRSLSRLRHNTEIRLEDNPTLKCDCGIYNLLKRQAEFPDTIYIGSNCSFDKIMCPPIIISKIVTGNTSTCAVESSSGVANLNISWIWNGRKFKTSLPNVTSITEREHSRFQKSSMINITSGTHDCSIRGECKFQCVAKNPNGTVKL